MKPHVIALAAVLAASGCATRGSNYRPTVDGRGVIPSQLESDTRECQEYAARTAGAGEGAVFGALAGGIIMALLAPPGYASDWAASGAAVGAAGAQLGQTVVRRRSSSAAWRVAATAYCIECRPPK